MLLEVYWKWYCQREGNSWEEFNTQITKNYLLNIMKPVRKIKAIKAILINIKRNFKKQADDQRDNWEFIVNADSQKSLLQERGCRFTLKKNNKPKINLKHSAYYILLQIACVDDYCNLHYTPKAKYSKYPRKMNWDDSKKKF